MPSQILGMGCSEETKDWMQVPDEVIIREPNRHGAPVVWWMIRDGDVAIRCYAPGGGY